ncbi:MAG: Sua5/YciO/YrdC/YwlC family protein [Deltaproteobacteria bacterium]|nr:Sua5/YciO/YrdC/YwlC family protein [Deltaproteobacteria bacterium]
MKTLTFSDSSDGGEIERAVAAAIESGDLVCLPCGGKYRLLADLTNVDAVLRLMQSKGRVGRAPALVFIDGESRLGQVADEIDPVALRLARALWPQPLTIRVRPSAELPGKVVRQLGGAKSKLGVRVPSEPWLRAVVTLVDRPLLVSSANKQARAGESSAAQVRRSFGSSVALLVDRGDVVTDGCEIVPGPIGPVDRQRSRLFLAARHSSPEPPKRPRIWATTCS